MLLPVVLAVTLADVTALAKLPGEPSMVGAAAITTDEQPVSTIEARGAFDDTPKRRVAVIGSPDAVIDVVRWMKTRAPAAIRNGWSMSALADPGGVDEASRARWVTFQAADIVVNLAAGDRHPVETVAAALRSAPRARSRDRAAMLARAARDPLAIAKLLARRYPGTPSISYIPSVAWANTLKLARITNEPALRATVERQTAPWRTDGKDLFGPRVQLTSVAGTFVFGELGATDVLAKGVEAASRVRRADLQGPSNGDVYEHGQGWTDDMFMATVVLVRGGKIDLASRMLIAYATRLQRPDGVFVHAPNGPVAWGRGNGFAALGLTEALAALDQSDPSRAPLLDIYRRQMDAARRLQAPDGMWNEVLDEPGSYREESATAMLLTAMARGIRARWLDRSFTAVVDRAWRALAAHVAEDGTVVDVCTSTGAGPTKRYYLDRAAVTGADDRGGAMALLAAVEVYELRHPPAVAAQ